MSEDGKVSTASPVTKGGLTGVRALSPFSTGAEKIAVACIAAAFIGWSALFIYRSSFVCIDGRRWFCLFDDAMISMRYAWNLSHGNGLVWNAGQRVEGYTNLSTTLIMAALTSALDKRLAVLAVQALGIPASLVTAYLAARIADLVAFREDPRFRANLRTMAFGCTLFYYPLAYWGLMGMETGLVSVLVAAAVLHALKYERDPHPSSLVWMAIALGLSYPTRPDSLILAGLLVPYVFFATRATLPFKTRAAHSLAAIGIVAVCVAGVTAWRWSYYGEIAPNSYTLKLVGMPLLVRLKNGARFIAPFLMYMAPVYLLIVIGLDSDLRRSKLLLLLISVVLIAYQVYVGGDPWVYWRMVTPSMALVFVLAAYEILRFTHAISATPFLDGRLLRRLIPARGVPTTLAFGLAVLALTLANARFVNEMIFRTPAYQVEDNKVNVNTALALNAVTTRKASIAVVWAGAIPYVSGRFALDALGKSDKRIARLSPDLSGAVSWSGMTSVPGHNKYDLNYTIKAMRPTYTQMLKWGGQDLSSLCDSVYVPVEYKGFRLLLRKGSRDVSWKSVRAIRGMNGVRGQQ